MVIVGVLEASSTNLVEGSSVFMAPKRVDHGVKDSVQKSEKHQNLQSLS